MRDDRGLSFFLIFMLLVVTFGVAFVCFGPIIQGKADLPRMDSLAATFTADGDCIKLYVIRDPDTGLEYLVSDHGGITPRLGYNEHVIHHTV